MNNWYVITGSPCSGKSTIISELKKRGYDILEETARVYINKGIANGQTLKELRKDESKFQKEILIMQIDMEKTLPNDKVVFLDRGVPDTWAYFKFHNLPDDLLLSESIKKCSYKKVFIADPLPYRADYARIEKSDEEQMKLHELLHKAYELFNIEIIKVPVMPLGERVEFILKHL